MKPIIEVRHLSKKYRLGEHQPYLSLRDNLSSWIRHPDRLLARRPEFWALRQINLSIKEGEVVGIIGKNGAGKSTLLKILSRITPPTTGSITLRGRIASLLEVGTGFHPELTGKENIYLNGSILGMTRAEINSKYDQIVAFAEIDKFLDTPVKHYSSGMYMRLAFAVAAHLDPEILIIDEVLSVGDAHFQKKSLGRMNEVARQGRTVIFVSHNLDAIRNLCHRVVYLEDGRIKKTGSPSAVIASYLKEHQFDRHSPDEVFPLTASDNSLVINRFSIASVSLGKPLSWSFNLKLLKKPLQFNLVVAFENDQNQRILACTSLPSVTAAHLTRLGTYTFSASLPHLHLAPGYYRCSIGVRFNDQTVIYQPDVGYIKITDTGQFPGQNGVIRSDTSWQIRYGY